MPERPRSGASSAGVISTESSRSIEMENTPNNISGLARTVLFFRNRVDKNETHMSAFDPVTPALPAPERNCGGDDGRNKFLVLSSSLLVDRVLLHTSVLTSLNKKGETRVWATSATGSGGQWRFESATVPTPLCAAPVGTSRQRNEHDLYQPRTWPQAQGPAPIVGPLDSDWRVDSDRPADLL